MSVVISDDLYVAPGAYGLSANNPIVGYNNIVTSGNIAATTEDPDYPVTNLANPATHLLWKSGAGSPTSDEYLTITTGTASDLDYLAIARHNLGTAQAAVSVEGWDTVGSPTGYIELTAPRLLTNDNPVIFRWTAAPYPYIRLRIQDNDQAVTPYIAVLYVGKLLLLQRRIYVGHTPISYGRSIQTVNHRSINGDFLGRIITSRSVSTKVSLNNLTPDWYRDYLDPFFVDSQDNPFFFAWRPEDYPQECGYGWMTNDPTVSNQQSNGMMTASWSMAGVV